ncbi:glycosyltransferase [Jiulongibacter sp. NS-SX5]|uniref:glycosyltransferase n=1 Tax=Jiulongibacter sp. NS-SX5 TaxID=3463854 RepID=UPI0040588B2A
MKIAIVSIVFPYPIDSGGSAGTFNLIEYSRKFHDITFICPNVSDVRKQKLQELWPNVKIMTTPANKPDSMALKIYKTALALKQKFTRTTPDYFYPKTHLAINDLSRCHYPGLIEMINKELEENAYDLLQVEFIDFAGLVNSIKVDIPKVFIHHEIRFKRLQMEYEALKEKTDRDIYHIEATKDLEVSLLNKYDKVVTVSDQDVVYLEEAGVKKELLYSSPIPIKLKKKQLNQPFSYKNKVVFLGPENHYPNLDGVNWFLETAWEEIVSTNPETKFLIVSKWSEEFQKRHSNKPNVEFTGFVEDLSEVFDGALLVVPLRIVSGMRMKILEGVSWRVPIISTTAGAEGLPMIDGQNCMIANKPEEFISKINQLIKDPKLANNLLESSQEIALHSYHFENCGKRRNNVYEKFNSEKVLNA